MLHVAVVFGVFLVYVCLCLVSRLSLQTHLLGSLSTKCPRVCAQMYKN